jgi:hypothetical protein
MYIILTLCLRPCQTVALDPDYAVKKSRQFVTGGLAGNLVLNSKVTHQPTNPSKPYKHIMRLDSVHNYTLNPKTLNPKITNNHNMIAR